VADGGNGQSVAVLGAGIAGLTAAHRLALAGHRPTVYERWPGLGGQVATIDVGDGHLLERYYHHLFTSDREIVSLYEELGMNGAVDWLPSSVAFFADGSSHPFTSPGDLLRFRPLSVRSRLRMGLAVLWLQRRHRDVGPFEQITAREWIVRAMGTEVWERIWGPLLRGKFGDRADDISMAWLWSKLTLRRQIKGAEARQELLGYPMGSWQPLLERLRDEIEQRGGRVLIDRPALRLAASNGGFDVTPAAADSFRRGHDPQRFEPGGEPDHHDAVIATVPSDVLARLLDPGLARRIGDEYLARVTGAEYHTALCVLCEIERSLTTFYWTNIADPEIPFVGLIEHTNLIDPERYDGRRFLYIANYVAPGDPLLELDFEQLLARYEPGLRKVNPAWSRDWVKRFWVFSEPAAQPIVTPGYGRRIPPLRTGVPGLVVANTTQIYPEDRGTNYSVRLGDDAAAALLAGAEA
jgi:protoporphyrinogen oxidase